MAAGYNTIDLAQLRLSPGQGRRIDVETTPGDLSLGGQRYAVGTRVPTRIDVSRTATGYALRLRFVALLTGPCMRCLEDADVAVEVDAREVHQPSSGDEELTSPYLAEAEELDLVSWAHDALVLALPAQLLCRADCAGLCPVCGESLNNADPADHEHGRTPDPRWAKLRELGSG
jgi:uncharacterized protein